MGYRAGVLCESDDAPAAQVADWVVAGAADQLETLKAFALRADAVTVEFENVIGAGSKVAGPRPAGASRLAGSLDLSEPAAREALLGPAQDPARALAPVRNDRELDLAVRHLGLPLVLKTAASGYDGKGQILVTRGRSRRVAPGSAWAARHASPRRGSNSSPSYRSSSSAAATAALHATRSRSTATCATSSTRRSCPRRSGPIVAQEARCLAVTVAQALSAVGVLAVEFFLTGAGRLLVNEIAPRPHNSGHLTIEAAVTSQFEQQVRALCGLPLGSTDLLMPAAMVNLLGDLWGQAGGEPHLDAALALDSGVSLHLYGKADAGPRPQDGPSDRPRPRSAKPRSIAPGRAPRPGRWPARQPEISHRESEPPNRTWPQMLDVRFAHPGWLWLLVLVPLPFLLDASPPEDHLAWLRGVPARVIASVGTGCMRLPPLLRGLAIASLAVALARPQTVGGETRIAGKGVAIVVALDQSSSMNAVDFPDRARHSADLAAGSGQDDVHALCRGSER